MCRNFFRGIEAIVCFYCLGQERAVAEAGSSARKPGLRDGTEGLQGFAWGSVVVGGPLDEGSEFDRRLACGAAIACRLRGAVREQLGECTRTCRPHPSFICRRIQGLSMLKHVTLRCV